MPSQPHSHHLTPWYIIFQPFFTLPHHSRLPWVMCSLPSSTFVPSPLPISCKAAITQVNIFLSFHPLFLPHVNAVSVITSLITVVSLFTFNHHHIIHLISLIPFSPFFSPSVHLTSFRLHHIFTSSTIYNLHDFSLPLSAHHRLWLSLSKRRHCTNLACLSLRVPATVTKAPTNSIPSYFSSQWIIKCAVNVIVNKEAQAVQECRGVSWGGRQYLWLFWRPTLCSHLHLVADKGRNWPKGKVA